MFFKKKKTSIAHPAKQITLSNFNNEVIANEQIVLLDFWAPWCGPCKVMGPILDELSDEYQGRALIGKVNVDQEQQLSQHFQVRSIPTLVFIHKGEIVEHFNGVVPKPNLEEVLNKYC